MDRRELIADPEEMFRAAFGAFQAGLWTAMPGIIQSFNPSAQTASVQPALKAKIRRPDTTVRSVTLPLIVDVPVVFPAGGGFTLTFPVKAGDECLLVFASRCIDAWWQSGGVQEPMEARMHDLSDGFAFVGARSQVRVLNPAVDTSNVQLRSDDGEDFVEIRPDGTVKLEAKHVIVHGRESYTWDVNGYGQKLSWVAGAGKWQMTTWQIGAEFLPPIELPINPPEGP